MRVKRSIDIYDDDNILNYINEEGVFIGNPNYTYSKVPIKQIENTIIDKAIIHMIPTHDTTDEEGSLTGYCDSLFFRIVVYNTDTMEYCTLENRDAINFHIKTETRIFKDLSTMIICKEPCRIGFSQAVSVYDV